MKYLFILLFPVVIFGQKFEELKDGEQTYFQYIATFDSTLTKDKLFSLMRINLMATYRNTLIPSDVIDEGEGKMFAKCQSAKLVYDNGIKKDGGKFQYHLHIICKNGKAKIVVNNIQHSGGEMVQMKDGSNFTLDEPDTWNRSFIWNKQSKKEWGKMKDQFRAEINTALPKLIKVDKTTSDDF